MQEQITFKERVCNVLKEAVPMYTAYFVNYDYLLCSEAFKNKPYYIISAHEDNFKHLTGVQSALSPMEFYHKAQDGTLSATDISFIREGQTQAQVRGSVRRKISVLSEALRIFSDGTQVEEDFTQNRIRCSFVAGRTACTLGFTTTDPTKPMTLLKGNELNDAKARPLNLVLRRPRGQKEFNEIMVGDVNSLRRHFKDIQGLLSENMIAMLLSKEEECSKAKQHTGARLE